MARLETKIIQVENSPSTLNQVNEEWGNFGWEVQNVQITYSQDTRTYTKTAWDLYSGDKTVETTTINYATITYQRNKDMDHNQEIAQLENEYNNDLAKMEAIITGAPDAHINWFVAIYLLFLLPLGIIYLIIKFKQKKARNDYYAAKEPEFERLRKHRVELRRQAYLLVG